MNESPEPSNTWKWLAIIFGASTACLVCFILLVILVAAFTSAEPPAAQAPLPETRLAPTVQAAELEPEEVTVIEKSLGQPVPLPGLAITVHGVEERHVLQGTYSTKASRTGAKFVLIDMTVSNTGHRTTTFFPDHVLTLVEPGPRQYETYDDSILTLEDHLNVRHLASGIPERGKIVYEIPETMSQYYLAAAIPERNMLYYIWLHPSPSTPPPVTPSRQ